MSSEEDKWATVEWEEGIIGKVEKFFLERFNFHPLWARGLGTTLVSATLGNMDKFELSDEWDDVYANLFFTYIGRSGLAIKTPPIKMLKKILVDFNRDVLCPTNFNPESFAEWVEGTSGKIGDKQRRKKISPHPINICVADEASRILGNIKFDQNKRNLPEFISKLWDNEIEGKYTRGMQIEGNINVYFSLLAASSKDFYRLLDKPFFTQGLGNRILWIIEQDFKPPEINPNKFFYHYAQDNKFTELRNTVVDSMRKISECYGIWIEKPATELWAMYANKVFGDIVGMKDNEAEYSAKVALNSLKLSMCYAASRLNIDLEKMIHIDISDMHRAIEDGKKYLKMWKLAMIQWADFSRDDNEERIKTSKYDVEKFVRLAVENSGTVCVSEIMKMGYPDRNKINERLVLGVEMGYFELVNAPKVDDKGSLTDEQYRHYVEITHGNIPLVYRVTKKGYEKCNVQV